MYDKKIYIFLLKKKVFCQIKYLNYAKCKIKLKKTTTLFVSCLIFVLQLKICTQPQINRHIVKHATHQYIHPTNSTDSALLNALK